MLRESYVDSQNKINRHFISNKTLLSGMDVKPTKNADGSYTIKLSEAEKKVFQINQVRTGGIKQFNITMEGLSLLKENKNNLSTSKYLICYT